MPSAHIALHAGDQLRVAENSKVRREDLGLGLAELLPHVLADLFEFLDRVLHGLMKAAVLIEYLGVVNPVAGDLDRALRAGVDGDPVGVAG
jgi:hypothetical protein